MKNITDKYLKKSHIIFFLLISVFFVLPILAAIRLLYPFILIRIGFLFGSRIGDLASETDLYLCRLKEGYDTPKRKFIDIHFIEGSICNKQLLRMWKRKIIILPYLVCKPVYFYSTFLPDSHIFCIPRLVADKFGNIVEKFPPQLQFNNTEEKIGENYLKSIGLKENDKYVCLIVRDNAYLKSTYPNYNWDYHDYRDCNIDNYKLATKKLTKEGYFVFRMGKKVNQPFSLNEKVIDYANSDARSDFLDIYLCAKCDFLVSSGLGLDAVSHIFRRPIVYTNIVPIGIGLWTGHKKYLATIRHHFSSRLNRRLSVKEICNLNLHILSRSYEFKEKEILLEENTSEEIKDIVNEMILIEKNKIEYTIDDNKRQKLFWKNYHKDLTIFKDDRIHGKRKVKIHDKIKMKIGKKFLENNLYLLN